METLLKRLDRLYPTPESLPSARCECCKDIVGTHQWYAPGEFTCSWCKREPDRRKP